MPSGRKPGYKHSAETKEKMRQSKLGIPRSSEDREAIAQGRTSADSERRCMLRFLDMRSDYPGYEDFFDNNKDKLLKAMRDVKTEKELQDIRRYIEIARLEDMPQVCLSYQYESSSLYAQEDVMIELLDTVRFLKKFDAAQLVNSSLSDRFQ